MLLYMGPSASDVGLTSAPLTQASLSAWAQRAGGAVIDRGTLFGSNGSGIMDNGVVHAGPLPIHGYSIVQAESLAGAAVLIQGHPFLTNGRDANFEIQILELTTGERPLAIFPDESADILPSLVNTPAVPTPPTRPAAPEPVLPLQPQTATPPQSNYPNQELSISHDDGPPESRTPSAGSGMLPPPAGL